MTAQQPKLMGYRLGTNPTVFHLVRHATYGLIGHVLAGRTPGHRLNPAGQAQAAALAASLAALPIAAIVSSPLERTRETAEAIAAPHGLPVQIEPDLIEIDFGEWTGSAFPALHALPEWRAFNSFRSSTPIPGGETMLAAQSRAVAAILRQRAAHPGSELVVVSHGDVVKAILAHFLGMPLDLFRRLDIAPGSRSVLALHDEDAQVRAVNLPSG